MELESWFGLLVDEPVGRKVGPYGSGTRRQRLEVAVIRKYWEKFKGGKNEPIYESNLLVAQYWELDDYRFL